MVQSILQTHSAHPIAAEAGTFVTTLAIATGGSGFLPLKYFTEKKPGPGPSATKFPISTKKRGHYDSYIKARMRSCFLAKNNEKKRVETRFPISKKKK